MPFVYEAQKEEEKLKSSQRDGTPVPEDSFDEYIGESYYSEEDEDEDKDSSMNSIVENSEEDLSKDSEEEKELGGEHEFDDVQGSQELSGSNNQ